MQILRLLAARRFRRRRRRAVSTITATAPCGGHLYYGEEEDEGPFFDLDLSCRSAPASTAGSQAAESGSESDDSSFCYNHHAAGDLDFVISLHRSSRTASPCYEERLFFRGVAPPAPPPLKFCASEPSRATAASRRYSSSSSSASRRLQLRTLSFGSAKAALYGGRASFSRSSSRSSARSARLFASPDPRDEGAARGACRTPSGDVLRRYLSKISSRLRRVAVAPGAAAAGDSRLRKSRSASAAQMAAAGAVAAGQSPTPARRDDTFIEKQDGIASAIAHCKESLHRASISECDTSLLRSRSDPGAGAVGTS